MEEAENEMNDTSPETILLHIPDDRRMSEARKAEIRLNVEHLVRGLTTGGGFRYVFRCEQEEEATRLSSFLSALTEELASKHNLRSTLTRNGLCVDLKMEREEKEEQEDVLTNDFIKLLR